MAAQPAQQQPKTEAELIAEIDARTDRTRRSLAATAGNLVMVLSFIALPSLPGGANFPGAFETRHAVVASGILALCFVIGAVLYRVVGTQHPLYRAVDALELSCIVGYTVAFPLIEPALAPTAAVFALISTAFWGQGKPGCVRPYAVIIAIVGAAPVAIDVARGEPQRALVAAAVAVASLAAYLVSVRARLETVRAELRRNGLRDDTRARRVAHERERLGRELSDHLFSRIDVLASQLERAQVPEAAAARRLSEMATELLFPNAQPVELAELGELLRGRCQALCPTGLTFSVRQPHPAPNVSAQASRALLRIAQELVRNAVTHGQARTIEVALTLDGDRLRLHVDDDGSGLSAEGARSASGGLRNARAWAAACDGTVELAVPRPGFQTCFVVTVRGAPPDARTGQGTAA